MIGSDGMNFTISAPHLTKIRSELHSKTSEQIYMTGAATCETPANWNHDVKHSPSSSFST
jgi:hypothetical protein